MLEFADRKKVGIDSDGVRLVLGDWSRMAP